MFDFWYTLDKTQDVLTTIALPIVTYLFWRMYVEVHEMYNDWKK